MTLYQPISELIEKRLGEFIDIHPPARREAIIARLAEEIFAMLKPEGQSPGWVQVPEQMNIKMQAASVGEGPCLCKVCTVRVDLSDKWPEIIKAV